MNTPPIPTTIVDPLLIAALSDEVTDWCRSDKLLAGSTAGAVSAYTYDNRQITFDLRSVSDWFYSTDVRNTDTTFVDLAELTTGVEECCRSMHAFGPKSVKTSLYEYHETVRQLVVASANTYNVGKKMYGIDSRGMDLDKVVAHFQLTIIDHLSTVIDTRVLTLSKRYAPAEAIFTAYQQGLFPFGWDWDHDSLWCLDPSTI
jgi:hypothetical protein